MTKKIEFVDRRGSIRLKIPIAVEYNTPENLRIHKAITKDISAEGARFEAHDKYLRQDEIVDMKLFIPGLETDIAAKGKVIWKRRLSLEDKSPFDIGIEFDQIDENGKNPFLKFLCDFIYNLPEEKKNAEKCD